MRMGMPYPIRNTVSEFEEGKRIAWHHFDPHIWRYELEPVDDGTKVTETFDWGASRAPWLLAALRFPERNGKGMEQTLERLDRLVTGR